MDESEVWTWAGREMDSRPAWLHGEQVSVWLARTLLKIRDKSGHLVPLRANAVQRAFEERRGTGNIVLKARQMGMTTWISGRMLLKTMLVPGTLTVQVAQTREAAEAIFQTVQRMWENLPDAAKQGLARRSRSNLGQMVFAETDSEFRVLSAADENAGRSLRISNLHCTEVSRWTGDAGAVLAGLKAALVPGGELVLESTPNGAHGCFYEEWQAGSMVQHFFPWWMEEGYVGAAVDRSTLTDEECRLVGEHALSLGQIGYRRGLQRQYRGLARQEFAEDAVSCFRESGSCVFDATALRERMEQLAPPAEVRRGGALHVWLPPVKSRNYIVAADPAGGGSEGDNAAVEVIDCATGTQCAELAERIAPRELARAVEDLAREYEGALIVIERNNHGAGVLAHLEGRGLRLYEQRGQCGWLTDAACRPEMIGRLGVLLSERGELFQSARLLEECRTFISTQSGRAEAARNAHDDCVMAMAIAQAVRAEVLEGRAR